MNQYKVSAILIYGNNKKTISDSIDSVLSQSFPNIELICVNNGSKDTSEETVKKISQKDSRVKLIKLPQKVDITKARQAGLAVAEGKFIVFLTAEKTLDVDIVSELYYKPLTDYSINDNRLYRRTFLENDEEISEIIDKKVEDAVNKSVGVIDEQKREINKIIDEFQKVTADNIKNSTYELTCRFNQLEKNFYAKDEEYKKQIDEANKPNAENLEKNTKQIYEDISLVYDYINSEINKKGMEINKVYEEISKNYAYTENLVSSKIADIEIVPQDNHEDLYKKLSGLEKEIVLRYVNLKRILDMQTDEINTKIKTLAVSQGNCDEQKFEISDLGKTVSDNLDNVYSSMNKISASFYEELSKIYKEINEKLNKRNEDEKYLFDKKLSELKIELQKEFDEKLRCLKEEIKR